MRFGLSILFVLFLAVSAQAHAIAPDSLSLSTFQSIGTINKRLDSLIKKRPELAKNITVVDLDQIERIDSIAAKDSDVAAILKGGRITAATYNDYINRMNLAFTQINLAKDLSEKSGGIVIPASVIQITDEYGSPVPQARAEDIEFIKKHTPDLAKLGLRQPSVAM